MVKLEIPKIRYLCQDAAGYIWCSIDLPYILEKDGNRYWLGAIKILLTGKPNPNWKNALIDLKRDLYDIVDGILIPKGKKVRRNERQI